MDITTESELAAMIMMSGSGGSAEPLSLEGIKKLRTLATVTIGSYVFEIKEPRQYYGGSMRVETYYEYKSGYYDVGWFVPVFVTNGVNSIAAVSSNLLVYDTLQWGNFTVDGVNYSTQFYNYKDFKVTTITVNKQSSSLPNLTIKIKSTKTQGYDGIVTQTTTPIYDSYFDFKYISLPTFTDLSVKQYYDFIKSYLEIDAVNEPVIEIL